MFLLLAGGATADDEAACVHRISIVDMRFRPASLEVQLGDLVEWTNSDLVAHTATAVDGAFDTGTLESGQSKRVVVARKGTFPYACRYHTSMKGTLTVR